MENITGEHHRGSIGDLRVFQKPGLESFRRFIRGELPAPPISRLVGMRPTEAGLGKATFIMPVTRWLEDGFGLYWGGLYALFADAPLASAIWTTLPAGKAVATSELSISFVRPMSRKTANMTAWFSNGGPSIYGGLLAWAAEFTMGAAVYSTLSPGDVFATLDMQIRFTRPARVDSGDLTLAASVRHRGTFARYIMPCG